MSPSEDLKELIKDLTKKFDESMNPADREKYEEMIEYYESILDELPSSDGFGKD
jgi:hypothetical protein